MIEVSITEMVLFAWAFIATAFWHDAHNHRKQNMHHTIMLLRQIAQNKIKVVETEDHFEFKEVK
jgi:hypothetical protein